MAEKLNKEGTFMYTREQKETFKGAGVLIITPFHDDLSLNCDGIRKNMAYIISQGLTKDNGFFVTDGSMGECSAMTIEERKQVIKTTVECAKDIPVVAGVNDTSVMNVIELANYAKNVGAQAILLTPPYYHVYDTKQIISFYRYIHDHTSNPIFLYNNPMICGVDLSISALQQLAGMERIFAIKQATLMTTNFIHSKDLTDKLLLFAASSSQQPFGGLNGASGFISFLSSINFKMQLSLWEAIKAKDWETAMRYHEQELEMYGWWWNGGVEQHAGQIVHIKKALDLMGLCGGMVRPPLLPVMSENELNGLKKIMKEWGLIQ
jgi:4-hydroxy-tetrahydrodipicolinate synthase